MISSLLIALAAGAASAVMFASMVSGALIAIFLSFLAPLPLMVAALGWGPLTATIGGIAAAISLGLLLGMGYLAIFVATVALPAWWLGHLALLGRPGATPVAGQAPAVEWYPLGRLLLWIAGFAVIATLARLFVLGTDSDTILSVLQQLMKQFLQAFQSTRGQRFEDIDGTAAALAQIAPSVTATLAILTLALNLWLAGRITLTSGRLPRPWPDLHKLALPPMTLASLCVAIALTFVGGIAGMTAQIATATLLMAYAFAGTAALHALTVGVRGRGLMLGMTYVMTFMLGWPVLALVCLGLADAIFGFRQRLGERRPPETAA